MKKTFFIGIVLLLGIFVAYFYRFRVQEAYLDFEKSRLPAEILDSQTLGQMTVAEEINLPVPFSTQAPLVNWNLPYQEACEEASVILVDAFYRRRDLMPDLTPEQMDREILALVDWEKKHFGFYKHTTVADTARILREYFGYDSSKVHVRYDFSLEDLRGELRAGHPVIVPLAGRDIGNKFYRPPGPVYHMLVVKGFTKDGRFITNDVGTRHGHNLAYDEDVLYAGIHDAPESGDGLLTEEIIRSGRKAMVVVY